MSTLVAPFYDPVVRDEHLERLETIGPSDELSPDVWEEVHQEVQKHLAELDDAVLRRLPDVRIEGGRTAGQRFFLYTYRTLSQADDSVDPVVVGLAFISFSGSVCIEADASGERSGDPIVTIEPRTVASSRSDVMQAVLQLADELAKEHSRITDSLLDPSRSTT